MNLVRPSGLYLDNQLLSVFSSKTNSCMSTVKPVLSGHSKRRPKIGFQDRLSLLKCRLKVLQKDAIFLTFIKLQFVFKTFVVSIFEWGFMTGFTVPSCIVV